MLWVLLQYFVINREQTHQAIRTTSRSLPNATHANAITSIAMESQFIVAFIPPGIDAALRSRKAVCNHAEHFSPCILHHRFTKTRSDNPEDLPELLDITGVQPSKQYESLPMRERSARA